MNCEYIFPLKSFFISSLLSCSSKDGETANGTLKVLWRSPDFGVAEEQGIMGYDISWMCNKDGRENSTRVHSDASSCLIPVYHDR